MDKPTSKDARRAEYLDELLKKISDPVHKRLIQAYMGSNPVQSMESELGEILKEVLHLED